MPSPATLSRYRFILDVAKVCNCPAIYTQFQDRLIQARRRGETLRGLPEDAELAELRELCIQTQAKRCEDAGAEESLRAQL